MKHPLLWCGLFLLVGIGVASSINRSVGITKGKLVFDPLRAMLTPSVRSDLEKYDHKFVEQRALTFLHIIPGTLLLILVPFQFSSTLRTRHISFHRWSGRFVLLTALFTGLFGLLLTVPFIFTGILASSAALLFGSIFLFALMRAYIAIRIHDVSAHREWMIRAFSIAFGISVIRIVGGLLFLIVPGPSFQLLGISFWIGWTLSLGAGEWWIRRGRIKDGAQITDPRPI
ncbi:MAG: DUF2306 domain-containing protein [Acidobacteriota bacterium]